MLCSNVVMSNVSTVTEDFVFHNFLMNKLKVFDVSKCV